MAAAAELDGAQEDGLTRSAVRFLVNRAMARVELLEGEEFETDIGVTFRNESHFPRAYFAPEYTEELNAIFRVTFLVPASRNAMKVAKEMRRTHVQGYYHPEDRRIILIGERRDFDGSVVAHELIHALQHRRGVLLSRPDGYDRVLAYSSLIEGEASLVEARYTARCQETWRCRLRPSSLPLDVSNRKLGYLSMFPYQAGERFVRRVGLETSKELYSDPPRSTAQIIHSRDTQRITVRTPSPEGSIEQGEVTNATVGEATIAAMLAGPAITGQGIVTDEMPISGGELVYNFSASRGWVGGALSTYDVGGTTAYIWKTRWRSSADATEFKNAYVDMLHLYGGREVAPNVWNIAMDGFPGAIQIVVRGNVVTIYIAKSRPYLEQIITSV